MIPVKPDIGTPILMVVETGNPNLKATGRFNAARAVPTEVEVDSPTFRAPGNLTTSTQSSFL